MSPSLVLQIAVVLTAVTFAYSKPKETKLSRHPKHTILPSSSLKHRLALNHGVDINSLDQTAALEVQSDNNQFTDQSTKIKEMREKQKEIKNERNKSELAKDNREKLVQRERPPQLRLKRDMRYKMNSVPGQQTGKKSKNGVDITYILQQKYEK